MNDEILSKHVEQTKNCGIKIDYKNCASRWPLTLYVWAVYDLDFIVSVLSVCCVPQPLVLLCVCPIWSCKYGNTWGEICKFPVSFFKYKKSSSYVTRQFNRMSYNGANFSLPRWWQSIFQYVAVVSTFFVSLEICCCKNFASTLEKDDNSLAPNSPDIMPISVGSLITKVYGMKTYFVTNPQVCEIHQFHN